MKKIYAVFGLALAMLTVGCAKDATSDLANGKTIRISTEQTRTHLGSGETALQVLWSEGDKVIVNDTEMTIDSQYAGKSSASISIPAGMEAPYVIAYPASALAGGRFINIPVEQAYVASSFAEGAAIMVGEGDDNIAMKHVCGFLKITTSAAVKSVSVLSADSTPLAGKFIYDASTVSLEPAAGENIVRMTKEDGASDFIVALHGGVYANGIIVKIETLSGTVITKKAYTTSGVEIKNGVILNMPAIDLSAETAESNKAITDAATFKAFLEAAKAGDFTAYKNEDGQVVLGSDIDMTGVTLTGAAATDVAFDGVFDGRGYRIKNWTSAGVALFNTIAAGGTIKNIIIDSSCELSLPNELVGDFGFIAMTVNGTASGCENHANCAEWVGSISSTAGSFTALMIGNGPSETSVIENCINTGNISFRLTGTSNTTYIGGVLGRTAAKGGQALNCINEGNVTINVDETVAAPLGKNFYIGGVSGATNSGSYIKGCINYGDVSFNTPIGEGAAMIMAGVTSYAAGNLDDCINYGNVSYTTDADIKGTLVAGVIAYIAGEVNNAHNFGNVTVKGGEYMGRNSVGNLDGTKSTSTSTSLVGGVVAAGVPTNATSCKFKISNSSNHGNVSWGLTREQGAHTASAGRHCIGGIVGDSSGPITNCDNDGDVTAYVHSADRTPFTAINAGDAVYVGGIAGGNYYSKTQMEIETTNCTNSGNISLSTDNCHTTNNMVAGIIGWPGKESGNTSYRSSCKNYGKIHFDGQGLVRMGGITGNSNNIKDCENHGAVELDAVDGKQCVGGVTGFHSGGYNFTGCKNYGDVTAKTTSSTGGISGLVGFFGNAALTVGEGCAVNCNLTSKELQNVGMMIGGFNGTTQEITFSGVKVKGTFNGTELTAENFSSFLHGAVNYTEGMHVISGEFGE